MARITVADISDLNATYSTNPGSTTGVGQLVFAMRQGCGCHGGCYTLMGECASGCLLIPGGVSCYTGGGHSWGACCSACTTCAFTFGTGTYLALGSVMCQGATIWRRIS